MVVRKAMLVLAAAGADHGRQLTRHVRHHLSRPPVPDRSRFEHPPRYLRSPTPLTPQCRPDVTGLYFVTLLGEGTVVKNISEGVDKNISERVDKNTEWVFPIDISSFDWLQGSQSQKHHLDPAKKASRYSVSARRTFHHSSLAEGVSGSMNGKSSLQQANLSGCSQLTPFLTKPFLGSVCLCMCMFCVGSIERIFKHTLPHSPFSGLLLVLMYGQQYGEASHALHPAPLP